MKTDPNDPATRWPSTLESQYSHGLTKREYFAALALQGFLSDNKNLPNQQSGVDIKNSICAASVIMADTLIKKLNEEKE